LPSTDSALESSFSSRLPELGSLIADRYRLLEIVGKGGMGVVYRAEHVQLQQNVAVKLLLSDFEPESQAFKRFQQEARTAGMLDHPNIVRVSDFGMIAGRQPYLAMDYIAGISLDDVFRDVGVLPIGRFRHIFGQACEALEHAHLCGVVHRDIKPSNLMLVQRRKDSDFLKIVDFGLVKLMSFDGADEKLTSSTTLVGSPLYMSPEQCRGLEVDNRSDIYSLGCVMYRALSGMLPVEGESPMDTLYKHVSEQPLPISQVNPKLGCPLELERVIMKALSKSPNDRQQTMSELREEMEQACDAPRVPVVLAESPPAVQPPIKPSAKFNAWSWFGTPLVFSMFCFLIVNSMWRASLNSTLHSQTPIATIPAIAVPSIPHPVRSAAPTTVTTHLGSLTNAGSQPKGKLNALVKPIPQIPKPAHKPEEPGIAAEKRGIAFQEKYEFPAAEAAFETALMEQESAYGIQSRQLMPVLGRLAATCHAQRHLSDTMLYFRRFTDNYSLFGASPVPPDVLRSVVYVALDLAKLHATRGQVSSAESYFKWALALSKTIPDTNALAQSQYDASLASAGRGKFGMRRFNQNRFQTENRPLFNLNRKP
jgi:serine/threonine protein kinase